jgi:hypothetical protein
VFSPKKFPQTACWDFIRYKVEKCKCEVASNDVVISAFHEIPSVYSNALCMNKDADTGL